MLNTDHRPRCESAITSLLMATSQCAWQFEGQREAAELIRFLFSDKSMLKLECSDHDTDDKNLQLAYSADYVEDLCETFSYSIASFARKFSFDPRPTSFGGCSFFSARIRNGLYALLFTLL
jgi:hypothetical protein